MDVRIIFGFMLCIFIGAKTTQSVKLMDCKDRSKTCVARVEAKKKEYCLQDWTWARFVCCATCAKQLFGAETDPKTGVVVDPTDPKQKDDFYKKLKNPKLPCKDAKTSDGTSRTEWCRKQVVPLADSKPGACSRSFTAQTLCLESCRFEECIPPRPTAAPKPSQTSQASVASPSGNVATTNANALGAATTAAAQGQDTTKAISSTDSKVPLISP